MPNLKLSLVIFTLSLGVVVAAAQPDSTRENTFGEDIAFLTEHTELVILRTAGEAARVAVAPEYQGRVMTSTTGDDDGPSFGWINYGHIRAGEITPQVNPHGGEERLWLGPDGGQFSVYFQRGVDFAPSNWQVPAAIDTEPYKIVERTAERVAVRHRSRVTNYSGTTYDFQIDREITIVSRGEAAKSLGVDLSGASVVGYRSSNRLTNTGPNAWTTETGAPSLWLLGMYKPSPKAKVIVPYREGDADALGPVVNDLYLGKVPADRLVHVGGVVFFSGDGRLRSKIGVSPARSLGVCGSYDPRAKVLTIIKYTPPIDPKLGYVNSMLEIQDEPFAGDVINAYNNDPGPAGQATFYELETSSPALTLRPNETGEHHQETYHFQGPVETIDRIAKQVLGVTLTAVKEAL